MTIRRIILTFLSTAVLQSPTSAFHTTCFQPRHQHHHLRTTTALQMSSSTDTYLTPKLSELCTKFSRISNVKRRYMYLLELAKTVAETGEDIQRPENKVQGCLSTVYIDCNAYRDDETGNDVVRYEGWSDGLLTKGMMAVLLQGLDGHTADEIEQVQPEFIKLSKIDQALTPGRNNGYLNMLALMKAKAREAVGKMTPGQDEKEGAADADGDNSESQPQPPPTVFEPRDGKPMYNAMMSILTSQFQPTQIELIDNSDQHAGHAGSKGWEESGESHFELSIVSEQFEGVRLVKRHQMIYAALGDVMTKIHALQISAKATSEI